jgi:hypothetical protein
LLQAGTYRVEFYAPNVLGCAEVFLMINGTPAAVLFTSGSAGTDPTVPSGCGRPNGIMASNLVAVASSNDTWQFRVNALAGTLSFIDFPTLTLTKLQ